MLALGSIVAGAGFLLAGLLALVFRNPRAPRWTRPELVVFLSMIPVTAMIGFGVGYAFYGGGALLYGEGDVRELAALALVPAVLALIWRAVGVKRRLRAYADATAGEPSKVTPILDLRLASSIEEPPESPSPDPPPRRPTRKAA